MDDERALERGSGSDTEGRMLPDHSLRERESYCTRKLRTHFRTESEISLLMSEKVFYLILLAAREPSGCSG